MKFQLPLPTAIVLVAIIAVAGIFVFFGKGDQLHDLAMGVLAIAAVFVPSIVRPKTDEEKKADKNKPTSSPPPLPLLALALVAFLLGACTPAASADSVSHNPARETARAIVMLVAEGARSADELCASAGTAAKDATLLATCAKAYAVARPALLSAAAHIDTWEGIERKDVACAIGSAVRAVDGMVQALVAAGVKIPSLIVDAVKLGGVFAGGSCSS